MFIQCCMDMWSSSYTQTLPEVARLSYFIHFSLCVLQYKDFVFLDKYGLLLSAADYFLARG